MDVFEKTILKCSRETFFRKGNKNELLRIYYEKIY